MLGGALTYVVSPCDKFQRGIINVVLSAALVVLHPDVQFVAWMRKLESGPISTCEPIKRSLSV